MTAFIIVTLVLCGIALVLDVLWIVGSMALRSESEDILFGFVNLVPLTVAIIALALCL